MLEADINRDGISGITGEGPSFPDGTCKGWQIWWRPFVREKRFCFISFHGVLRCGPLPPAIFPRLRVAGTVPLPVTASVTGAETDVSETRISKLS